MLEEKGSFMMHPKDGELQSYLEPMNQPDLRTMGHVQNCPACQKRLAWMEARRQSIEDKLTHLSTPQMANRVNPRFMTRPALFRLKSNLHTQKESIMSRNFMFRSKAVWAALVAVLVLAGILSFPTGRVWASQFLNLFRVQQVTVIPIDQNSLSALSGNEALGKQMGQLLSDSIKMDKQPGIPQTASDAATASKLAGFAIRLPSGQTAPVLTVQGGTSFNFVVDRARAQALLDEAGHKDLVLPQSLDGETISVNIPNSVSAGYGNCPVLSIADNKMGSAGRLFADCVELMQIPSPTIEAPADVDLSKLAEIGLEFTGMSPAEAKQYSQSVNWASSLVIPIPRNAASYQTVTVDGVSGTLIQRPVDDAPQYALIWVKNSVIYAVGGLGSDTAQAFQIANSLP